MKDNLNLSGILVRNPAVCNQVVLFQTKNIFNWLQALAVKFDYDYVNICIYLYTMVYMILFQE